MRDMLQIQEHMDHHLDQRDKGLRQLRSQSQVDGAQLAALSLQMQELISSMESRAEVVGKDLEKINGRFVSGLQPTTHWHQWFSGRGWSSGGV